MKLSDNWEVNMGYVIMAYASEGYQEFVLPEIVDVNYTITLERQNFGMKRDLPVELENVDNEWKFYPSNKYKLRTYEGENAFSLALKDGMAIQIRDIQETKITLLVFVTSNKYPVYDKYGINRVSGITVGKLDSNSIEYGATRFVSRNHAALYRDGNRWLVNDNSSNGIYVNGRRVDGQAYLSFGDYITLFGLTIIFLGNYIAVSAISGEYKINDSSLAEYHPREGIVLPEENPVPAAKVYYKRSPRTYEKLYTEKIEIDAPPALNKTKKRPLMLTIGPSLTMALPMVFGCMISILAAKNGSGAYMFTGIITAVSSAVLGVVWAVVNLRYNGKEEEENEELRYNAYGQYLIDTTEFIKQQYENNCAVLFHMYSSGEECTRLSSNDVCLWNRNDHQKDFMYVRLGLGTIPFQAEISIPKEKFTLVRDDLTDKPSVIKETYKNLYSVPFCIDIRDKGIIGIIGGKGKKGAYDVAYNIIAQLAANNSYTDVKMVFLYNGDRISSDRWSFARWLPHVWMDDKKTRMVAGNKAEVGDIFYELATMLRMRMENQGSKDVRPLPHYVIFVEDPTLLEGELLENYIYNPRPEYGITTIFLAEKYGDLANSCENIIQNDAGGCQFFHVINEEERSRDLVAETVSKESLEALAIRLCDVEINAVTGSGEIPDSLDFFEMYSVETLEELNVLERWKKNRNYDNMKVLIGQKSGGAPCYLDIHEKYHGPHGLVAGTTGSGKSETLQTYILSLAVNFSPDDIAFFIIDFKGGGMANLFSGLPHMAGRISNLSGNQVRRAMISIKSENQHRQRVFAEHDVNNINSYTRLYKNHEAKEPVPHLFIIIDEFAELKREEPEFMKELISVAQVGRSLGVHLILATQKPSGTVDDNIWSNSKFRLCLRVQDRQDSNDMLHKPDASYITQAGRGYLQVGNDEIYEQFQSGYSGADYYENPDMNRSASAVRISRTGRQETGSTVRRKGNTQKAKSQLDAVIEYLDRIASRFNYNRRMVLWLPVLPARLYLDDLDGYGDNGWEEHTGPWNMEAVVGLYDDPVNQAQNSLYVNFSEGGHLAICGTVATGKSTFLQTLLYSLIHKYSPLELNYYVLDYSSRILMNYDSDPHCGGVVIDTDEDKVTKFFYMIEKIMEERKRTFQGGNYSQYVQAQRSKKQDIVPAVLVVIDNYSNFREKTDCGYDNVINRIAREGVGYGIFLVLTSAGFGSSEIPTRTADNIRTVISLEMGDKFKYAEVLRTTRVEIMPESDVKGRGLAYVNGAILEFQTAMCLEAEDSYQMSERIGQECRKMKAAWNGRCAAGIPCIPENPVFSEFAATPEYAAANKDRRNIPVGYVYEDASVYSIDLWNTYCYFIQGRERTGRRNVMKMMIYSVTQKENTKAVIIETDSSDMKGIAEQTDSLYITTHNGIFEFFKDTIPVFKSRNQKKRELVSQGVDNTEIARIMSGEEQVFIFIPDTVSFMKAVYNMPEGVGEVYAYLENITAKGSLHGFYFFGIISPDQITGVSGCKMYTNMASYKNGMHLGGNLSAQRFFQFNNISYSEQSRVLKPGSAYVPDAQDGTAADMIILPLVKGGTGTK